MKNKEKLISLKNIIDQYEKYFHPLPRHIVEDICKSIEWTLEQISDKLPDEKVEFLLRAMVFREIDKFVKEDYGKVT